MDASRIAVYSHTLSAAFSMKEEERMELWNLGVTVTDDPKQLQAFASAQPPWTVDEPAAEDDAEAAAATAALESTETDSVATTAEAAAAPAPRSAPKLKMEDSVSEGLHLASLKEQLEAQERLKATLADGEEASRKQLQALVEDKNRQLVEAVDQRMAVLSAAVGDIEDLVRLSPLLSVTVGSGEVSARAVGPHCGRDAALALAWLERHRSSTTTDRVELDADDAALLSSHLANLRLELQFLRQMALAAKVVAHVTSPMHKKLLNLCHNWLRTFMPHCLAKVNRVSFGLLSETDCQAALLADPHVPRSRLKLAVPFVGKDVPSKSSEFAHPVSRSR
jgi:ElaB/YqjD/DUF883 family membrane-anchored ribosome-binding protein